MLLMASQMLIFISLCVCISPYFFCREIIREFGLWDQIRVDCGREWNLMLFMQEHLSHLRNDPSKPPHLRSSSKNVSLVFEILLHCNELIKGCLHMSACRIILWNEYGWK